MDLRHDRRSGDVELKTQQNISHDQSEKPGVNPTHGETHRTVLLMTHFPTALMGCESPLMRGHQHQLMRDSETLQNRLTQSNGSRYQQRPSETIRSEEPAFCSPRPTTDEGILRKSGGKIHISRICHEINPLRGAQVKIGLTARSDDEDEEEEESKMKMKHQLNIPRTPLASETPSVRGISMKGFDTKEKSPQSLSGPSVLSVSEPRDKREHHALFLTRSALFCHPVLRRTQTQLFKLSPNARRGRVNGVSRHLAETHCSDSQDQQNQSVSQQRSIII
ncbi:hypothetical protein G5714_012193 [Onychostoma macrolepis]|uniref:Uncharacterized protein n=1 Tax=Onychostoma macrolepis TaxID=369639 RepID=A0A7J6CKI7_9TELE|nr:hypothetical protein G5714_012193 [Onychostoma macrolepis]